MLQDPSWRTVCRPRWQARSPTSGISPTTRRGSARPSRGSPRSSTTAAGAALSALRVRVGGARAGSSCLTPSSGRHFPTGCLWSRDLRAVHALGRAAAGPCRRRSTSRHDRVRLRHSPSSPSSPARPRWSRWRATTGAAPVRSSPPVDARCWCRLGPGLGWSSGSGQSAPRRAGTGRRAAGRRAGWGAARAVAVRGRAPSRARDRIRCPGRDRHRRSAPSYPSSPPS